MLLPHIPRTNVVIIQSFEPRSSIFLLALPPSRGCFSSHSVFASILRAGPRIRGAKTRASSPWPGFLTPSLLRRWTAACLLRCIHATLRSQRDGVTSPPRRTGRPLPLPECGCPIGDGGRCEAGGPLSRECRSCPGCDPKHRDDSRRASHPGQPVAGIRVRLPGSGSDRKSESSKGRPGPPLRARSCQSLRGPVQPHLQRTVPHLQVLPRILEHQDNIRSAILVDVCDIDVINVVVVERRTFHSATLEVSVPIAEEDGELPWIALDHDHVLIPVTIEIGGVESEDGMAPRPLDDRNPLRAFSTECDHFDSRDGYVLGWSDLIRVGRSRPEPNVGQDRGLLFSWTESTPRNRPDNRNAPAGRPHRIPSTTDRRRRGKSPADDCNRCWRRRSRATDLRSDLRPSASRPQSPRFVGEISFSSQRVPLSRFR